MMEELEVLQLNIRHYQHLLTLYSKEETQNRVFKLLTDAQARLPRAATEALDRSR